MTSDYVAIRDANKAEYGNVGRWGRDVLVNRYDSSGCFGHQLLLPRPYLVLTKTLRLDIQCQRATSVKISWKYLDD